MQEPIEDQQESPSEKPHWTSSIANPHHCPVCGAERSGQFCGACGQRILTERVNFWGMAQDLFERISNLEKGLLFTLVSLLRRPGQVAKDFISGKQKCYVNPLTVFLLGVAMQLVALWLTQSVLRAALIEGFEKGAPAQKAQFEELEKKLGEPVAEALADAYFSSIQQGYAYAALLFFCVPFAILLWWFHSLLGEPFRLGETTIFACYTMALMLFVTAVCTPITARLGALPQMIMAAAAYSLLPQWAHTHFFQRSWPSRLLTFVATVISVGTFVSSILVIFVVTFVVTIVLRIAS